MIKYSIDSTTGKPFHKEDLSINEVNALTLELLKRGVSCIVSSKYHVNHFNANLYENDDDIYKCLEV